MSSPKNDILALGVWLGCITLSAWHQGAHAAELDLADAPLFLGTSIEPNVFFKLDDSGSMDWESLTFDYHYYLTYWRNWDEDMIISGLWENSTDESVSTGGSGGGRGRGRGGRRGGGGGGGGGSYSDNEGERKEIAYLFKNNDRLYTGSGYTTPEDHSQIHLRDWRGRSVDFNLTYYDPTTNYEPWDSTLPDASFTAARSNPVSGTDGYNLTRNLNGSAFEVWIDDKGYNGDRPDGPDDATDGANGVVDLWDTHTRYTFDNSNNRLNWTRYTAASAATMRAMDEECDLGDALDTVPFEDCFGTVVTSGYYSSGDINPWGRTLAQEKQNFANWYSYYRKRSFVAKGAISRVIAASSKFRYGLSLINEADDVFVEVPLGTSDTFATHNAGLLEELFEYDWAARGTPLRQGLERVGEYYDDTLSGKADPIISQCQQNFSILISDGFWNGGNPSWSIGDRDGDGYSRTLADVAKYYYDKDLSPLPDDVPTSVLDGNNKQHMVTFTVAFGLRGALVDTNNDGYPDPELEEDDDWGNVYSYGDDQIDARIDDLWHAAFNSKGLYIQAQAPDDLVQALSDALSDITDRVGSSASVATNSGSLNAGSHLFQARFDSGGWGGELIAFAINADATLSPVPSWEASEVLDSQNPNNGRSILTTDPSTGNGIPFRWPTAYKSPVAGSELANSQINSLLTNAPFPPGTLDAGEISANQAYGTALLNFLRGDRSYESNAPYQFRVRNSALGDIVDSDPKFVGPPRFRYSDAASFAPKPYSDYVSANASRAPMVYVGANDGMLHGFLEDTGQELLAYVPNAAFKNLHELADPLYQHRNFVNEAPTIVDAYFQSKTDPISGTPGAWRTVLAGSLGGGGQGIYALDVSDPTQFSELNANDIVLWEFDDTDDADLGYTFGEVQIAKMENGSWAAVFSNGYNNTEADGNASATGHAYLYIVDIETGALIKKIDTGVGSTTTPNGLSTPSLIDANGNGEVDIIYAGDLRGNVWKFNVAGNNTANWDVAYKTGFTRNPLFTSINNQPITSAIQVALHPEGRAGFMLYFGTGKYIEPTDNSINSQPTQAFYGIWDQNQATLTAFNHTNLLQQSITDQLVQSFDTDGDMVDDLSQSIRKSTNHAIDFDSHKGWYINLMPQKVDGVANANNFGEKQVTRSVVRDGRVIFTTVMPSQDACDFGGSSFIMSLNYANGGQLGFPAFDLNGDGEFDDADPVISGLQSDVGIVPTVSILTDVDRDIAFASGSSGDVEVIELNVDAASIGRQSWRQLE